MSIFFVAIFWHSFFAFSTKDLGGTDLTACFSLLLWWDVVIIVAFGRLSVSTGRQASRQQKKGNFFIAVVAAWMIIIDWKTARHPTTDSTVLLAIAFLLFQFCFISLFAYSFIPKKMYAEFACIHRSQHLDVCYVCNEVTQCRLVLRSERKTKIDRKKAFWSLHETKFKDFRLPINFFAWPNKQSISKWFALHGECRCFCGR